MPLKTAMLKVHEALISIGAPHALIGGMALSAHGYPRATNDIDFLVHSDFRAASDREMLSRGFTLEHSTLEVAQWSGSAPIDFLFATRKVSRDMLSRAEEHARADLFMGIPVVDATDIIGLKIQAYCNNPKRLLQDLADIQKLIELNSIDWGRVHFYAEAFNEWERIKSIRGGC